MYCLKKPSSGSWRTSGRARHNRIKSLSWVNLEGSSFKGSEDMIDVVYQVNWKSSRCFWHVACRNGCEGVGLWFKRPRTNCCPWEWMMRLSFFSCYSWVSAVGLEIHAQISSQTKIFSESTTRSNDASPNSCVSLFDIAIPGTLPVWMHRWMDA